MTVAVFWTSQSQLFLWTATSTYRFPSTIYMVGWTWLAGSGTSRSQPYAVGIQYKVLSCILNAEAPSPGGAGPWGYRIASMVTIN